MSDVLRARLKARLDRYESFHLDNTELAAELLDAVLPVGAAEFESEPIWWRLVGEWGTCTNCWQRYHGCSCCPGCGQPDADIIGSHGSWCAL